MKKILFLFLFATVNLSLTAQQITVDTTYLTNTGGVFFQVRDIQYDDGSQNFQKLKLGDTLQTKSFLFSTAINSNQEVGGAAIAYLNGEPIARQIFSSFNTMYQSLNNQTLQVAAAEYFKAQVLGQYKYLISGVDQGDWELVQQPNGTLRFRLISNPATFFVAVAMSQNTIRLNNLDGTNNIPLYLIGTNAAGKPLYMSIDRKYRLVRIN